jgi:serine-type D-Ala-D-Ala carboxypeptidase (penicillin-binding protein 5/6)
MKKIISLLLFFSLLFNLTTVHANTNSETETEISLASNAAILMEANTGTILFENNAEEILYPASLTKIATAIYAIEYGNLEDIVTISKNARSAAGTRVYLEEGEQVSLLKLIQGLLINSGNDAGIAIAEHMSGSEEAFAAKLTTYIQTKTEAKHTYFKNATGLFHEDHVTTAKDLAYITQYAMKNKIFMEIFGKENLRWIGQSWDTSIVSHHRILNGELQYDGITGGKTGYVPQSRYTLSSTAERGNMHLIAIVLDGGRYDIYRDTIKLFNYGFEQFITETIDEDTSFNYIERSYINEQAISYVKHKDENVHTAVSPTGLLHITNEQGEIIKTASLVDKTPLPQAQAQASEESSLENLQHESKSYTENILLIISLVSFSIIVFARFK